MKGSRRLFAEALGAPAIVAACLAAAACTGRSTADPPPLQRLLPALGAASPVQLGREASRARPRRLRTAHRRHFLETRQALALRPGQSVSCSVDVAPGSRLDFAIGVLPDATEQGAVRIRVLANDRSIYGVRLSPEQDDQWHTASTTLGQAGRVTLTFQVDHVDREGRPLPTSAGSAEPWILLGSPRIAAPASPARRRVLVWISQDTVRADHLGAYGYKRQTTPRFDALAPEWALFENGVSPASWTLPAMTSQFVSRYPSFHGAVTEAQSRDRSQPSLFEVLAADGFEVFGLTGNIFVSDDFGLASGFDALWYTERPAETLVRLADRAFSEWAGGDIALLVHFQDPHHPYSPPPPFDESFDPGFHGTPDTRDPAQLAHTKALYDGEIAYTDHQIHILLRSLKARGLFGSTLVVYSADHGEEFLDHGAWAHARTVYDELIHVPFALRIPGIAGRRVPQVVSLVDLAPTVLDAFGLQAPASFQGHSLLPLLRGGAQPGEPVYAETQRNSERHHLLAVRDGNLKYILATQPGLAMPPEVLKEELYDLAADPEEKRPLRASPERERLRRYALSYLARAAAERRKPTPSRMTPEIEARLRALGYIQ